MHFARYSNLLQKVLLNEVEIHFVYAFILL